MCKICVDWEKGKMTGQEAMRAIGEMIGTGNETNQHYFDLAEKVIDKEVPLDSSDSELDEEWERKQRGGY
jgi:hypothetical protein